jgi:hypothetical protein
VQLSGLVFVVRGVAATPVMRLLDRTNERTEPTQSVSETP